MKKFLKLALIAIIALVNNNVFLHESTYKKCLREE